MSEEAAASKIPSAGHAGYGPMNIVWGVSAGLNVGTGFFQAFLYAQTGNKIAIAGMAASGCVVAISTYMASRKDTILAGDAPQPPTGP